MSSEARFIYLVECKSEQHDHTALANGGVACPHCGGRMNSVELVGAVVETVDGDTPEDKTRNQDA